MASWYTLHRTRYPVLGFAKFQETRSRSIWRIIALDDDADGERASAVGPVYRSKAELLADLSRYARENWGLS